MAVGADIVVTLRRGENAVAETVLEVFDQKIVRDATLTGVFYTRCDEELLKQAKVAQGLGGIWVNSEETDTRYRAVCTASAHR